MPRDPDELRKVQQGSFEREHEEEFEDEEELDVDFAVPGIANSEMEHAAHATRIKKGANKLSAEALAELTQPWGVSRYISGGDDDESGSPRRAVILTDDEDGGLLGSLDAPLWHGIAAAPPPPPRPPGFPPGSKWVRPS